MKWYPFNPSDVMQNRPDVGKQVLIKLRANKNYSLPFIVVGYLEHSHDGNDTPFFNYPILEGMGEPFEWADCLPEYFSVRNTTNKIQGVIPWQKNQTKKKHQ